MAGRWLSEFQWTLLTVYIIVAVDVFGLTLIVPVMVTYARFLGAPESSVGYLFAVYSGMALVSSLFLGKLSDKYGRRAIFLYCCIGTLISFVGSALSRNFLEFAICRGFSGLFTGTMGNAYAYIDDIVPDKDKALYISYVTATLSTCFIVGPIVGGGFAAIDIRAPFVAATGMATVELILIWFFVKDTNPDRISTTEDPLLLESQQQVTEPGTEEQISTTLRRTGTKDSSDALIGPSLGSALHNVIIRHDQESSILQPFTQEASAESEDKDNDKEVDDSKIILMPQDISPWLNFPALLIGGIGTFLSSMTYCGMAILIPFLLMDPDFGVVSDSDDETNGNNDDISSHDSKSLSLIIGYLLTMLGSVQVVGMLALFPRVNKRLGLVFTGSLGAFIYGSSFCLVVLVHSLDYLYPIVIGLAIGYSLCRPVYPAFLSSVAHPDRRADYQAMSASFVQMAWICSVALTWFWSYSHTGAILYSGGLSVLNSVILLSYGVYEHMNKPLNSIANESD